MTPADLKSARAALGLSASGFAAFLRMEGVHAGRTVRRWESGEQDIPGYVEIIVDLVLTVPAVRKRLGVTLVEPR